MLTVSLVCLKAVIRDSEGLQSLAKLKPALGVGKGEEKRRMRYIVRMRNSPASARKRILRVSLLIALEFTGPIVALIEGNDTAQSPGAELSEYEAKLCAPDSPVGCSLRGVGFRCLDRSE